MGTKQRYYSLNSYFRNKYGEKIYKISIDAGFSCPGTCSYCSSWGSLAPYQRKERQNLSGSLELRKESVKNQISGSLEYFEKKGIKKLFLYFQAFTNTYDTLENINEIYTYALSFYPFLGVIIGTRPDAISKEKLDLITRIIPESKELWIEVGLQSSHDKTLEFIERNHTRSDFDKACSLIRQYPRINLGTHIILGLPYETDEDLLKTVCYLNTVPIKGIKFHYLYLLEDSKLNLKMQNLGIKLLTAEELICQLGTALSYLNKEIVIFRLFSDPEPDSVAPKYSYSKSQLINLLDNFMEKNNLIQGCNYEKCSFFRN